jgi:hypothetical protein
VKKEPRPTSFLCGGVYPQDEIDRILPDKDKKEEPNKKLARTHSILFPYGEI